MLSEDNICLRENPLRRTKKKESHAFVNAKKLLEEYSINQTTEKRSGNILGEKNLHKRGKYGGY